MGVDVFVYGEGDEDEDDLRGGLVSLLGNNVNGRKSESDGIPGCRSSLG